MRFSWLIVVVLLAAPVYGQIERTTIERTTISAATTGEEEATCSTKSRTFDGTNQYFTSATGKLNTTGAFTVVCWVRPTDLTALSAVAAKDDGADLDWSLRLLGAGNGRARIYGYNGGSSTSKTSSSACSVGSWCLVAGAYDGVNAISASIDAEAWPAFADIGGVMDNDGGAFFLARAASSYLTGREAVCGYWGSVVTAGAASTLATINAGVYDCAGFQALGAANCWEMDGAAGSNEEDAIGSVDLTQVNSPGSSDGPGEGCE